MKKQDFIVIGIIVLIAAVIFGALHFFGHGGKKVRIEEGDTHTVYILDLNENTEQRFETEYGYNVVVIEDGYVYVKEADCRDKICVHHKKINKSGESIICLPHKLVVSIEE